jgi:hypothetical protein
MSGHSDFANLGTLRAQTAGTAEEKINAVPHQKESVKNKNAAQRRLPPQ